MPTTKKLKIIHTEASPHWGGQEIRIFEEMKWFREQGHEMLLVTPSNATLYKRATEEGFAVISLYFTKNRTLLSIFQMMMIIKRFRPDVVATHSSTDSWAGLIAAKLMRVRKRVRYRHVSTTVRGNFLNRWQYRSLSNLIITTGECIRKPLIQTFSIPREKIFSAPTAVQPQKVTLSKSEARINLRKELDLGSEARFIGQVSVLRSWKGHFVLFKAFSQIAQEFPDFHLVIVGDGPIEGRIIHKLKTHPLRERIHLVGYKSNPWPYFRAMEVAVLASLSNEGIPQSLLQAMCAEIPVIGTKVGGIPEIVFHGKTGLLVEPEDPVSMGQAIKDILNDRNLQNKLCSTSLELVRTAFRWDHLGTKVETLFDKFVNPQKETFDLNNKVSLNQFNQSLSFKLGIKRKVLLFAQHSSWGAASNFCEMFNLSGRYEAWEVVESDGGEKGYSFGQNNTSRKLYYNQINNIKLFFDDPDTIIFIFDFFGLRFFEKCLKKLNKRKTNRNLNVFWSGSPYMKKHKYCNKWVSKYSARSYSQLDKTRFSRLNLPLMQPYDLCSFQTKVKSSKSKFIICHSPGHKAMDDLKGTNGIRDVVSHIQEDFNHVEYIQIGDDKWLNHDECLRIKRDADVFIDQVGPISAGGLGKSGIESICFGIPTICSFFNSKLEVPYSNLYILDGSSFDSLKSVLKRMITDQEYHSYTIQRTMNCRSLFDYKNTLIYLEKTMKL